MIENNAAFALAITIIKAIQLAGGHTFFVGGAVRDRIRGVDSKDIDLEVYGIASEELRLLLERIGSVNAIGESFTVYKIGPIDIALPRRESKTGRGHRGFTVTGEPNLTVKEALKRRDFTINAIAWDPLTDQYLDPYSGRKDLAKKLLRAVDLNTFADDSLRVLRAIQFAARFNLEVETQTKLICQNIKLDDLPSERIWGEFEKLILKASQPSIGFQLARELGIIKQLFPEMAALIDCPQEPEWHPEGDVWTHNLLVIDNARNRINDLPRPQQITVMLGAICHDFGKPATTAFLDGRIRSYNHEQAGISPTETFLDRLNIHSLDGYNIRQQVLGLVAHHLKPGMWHKAHNDVGDGAFRRLAKKVNLELLARLAKSDCLGRAGQFDCSAMDWFLDRARALGVQYQPPKPLLMGRHLLSLGLFPSPKFGKILAQVYEHQLDGTVQTLEEAIKLARTMIK